MSVTTIANRYARALADVISERGEMNEVVVELNGFAGLMNGHAQLRDVFASPVISTERKRGVLGELLSKMQLRQTSSNFLRVLLENSRLHDLDQILKTLSRELDARTNIVSAEITTAREISQQEETMLADKLKAATGKQVRLQFRTDPAIIGGVVTRIGSLVYDGSIKTQLAQMKKRLLNA
ncbi:MAG TPA: ATP synthase F1 subunit delta [Blastocatellia bacterium]|nr:ATP synthase F1 subunit delta [Blastocatellia bacterium]